MRCGHCRGVVDARRDSRRPAGTRAVGGSGDRRGHLRRFGRRARREVVLLDECHRSPRLAASSATPVPVIPPPITRTSNVPRARRSSAGPRSKLHVRAGRVGCEGSSDPRSARSCRQPAHAAWDSRGRGRLHNNPCQLTIVGNRVSACAPRRAERVVPPAWAQGHPAAPVHLPGPRGERDASLGRGRLRGGARRNADDLAQDRLPDAERPRELGRSKHSISAPAWHALTRTWTGRTTIWCATSAAKCATSTPT